MSSNQRSSLCYSTDYNISYVFNIALLNVRWYIIIIKAITNAVDHLTQKFPGGPLNSRRFPGFSGGFLNSSRFPGFPGVVDTLSSVWEIKVLCCTRCTEWTITNLSRLRLDDGTSTASTDSLLTAGEELRMSGSAAWVFITTTTTTTTTTIILCPFVQDYPGEPVLEETFTHSHVFWSSTILYQLPPFTMIHSILPVQFTRIFCITYLQVLFVLPLGLEPSTSHSIHFLPNHCLLFTTHAHTIAICSAVVLRLCHLFLVFTSLYKIQQNWPKSLTATLICTQTIRQSQCLRRFQK